MLDVKLITEVFAYTDQLLLWLTKSRKCKKVHFTKFFLLGHYHYVVTFLRRVQSERSETNRTEMNLAGD